MKTSARQKALTLLAVLLLTIPAIARQPLKPKA